MKSELTLEILVYLPWKVRGISNHEPFLTLIYLIQWEEWFQKETPILLNGQFKLLSGQWKICRQLPELKGKSQMAICDKLNNLGYSWPKVKLEADFEVNEPGIYLHNYGNSIQVQCVPDYLWSHWSIWSYPVFCFSCISDIYGGIEPGWALNVNEIWTSNPNKLSTLPPKRPRKDLKWETSMKGEYDSCALSTDSLASRRSWLSFLKVAE